MSGPDRKEPDSQYSWLVAVVGAVAMVFTFGTPVSYGIFLTPFSDTFGVAPLALSGVFAAMVFTFFIGSGLVGVFGVRLPVRGVLLTCGVVTGAIAPSLYVVSSVFGLLVVFALLGLALGTVFVMLASVIPRWFDRRRGAATGLIFAGNGLGLFLLPPAWQRAFVASGVRSAFLGIMGITAVSFLLAGLVCRRPRWADASTATTAELLEWLSGLSHTRAFRLLVVGIALSFAWYQLLAAYAVEFFITRGLTESGASTLFGLIGGFSIISRLGGGYLSDRLGPRTAFLGSLGCVALGIGLFLIPIRPVLVLAVFLIGLGLGGTATIYLPLLMSVFSPEKDTAVVGVFNIAGGTAALLMPPLGTAVVTFTESYTPVLVLTLGLTLAGIWTVAAGTSG